MTASLVHLEHTRLSPDVILHKVLSDVANVRAVVVLAQAADGKWSEYHSRMSISDLCTAEKWLSLSVADALLPDAG